MNRIRSLDRHCFYTINYYRYVLKVNTMLQQEELEEWEKAGVLELYTAFSRDQVQLLFLSVKTNNKLT